jgi:hypothetical protein
VVLVKFKSALTEAVIPRLTKESASDFLNPNWVRRNKYAASLIVQAPEYGDKPLVIGATLAVGEAALYRTE